MLNLEYLRPLLTREANRIALANPAARETLDRLVGEFCALHTTLQLNTPADALDLCSDAQQMLSEHQIPEDILRMINDSRKIILDELLQHGLTHGSLVGDSTLRFRQHWDLNAGKRGRRPERSQQQLREIITEQTYDLIRLASWLGVDAAADVLCTLGLVGNEDRSSVVSLISTYLGESARAPALGVGGLLAYPRQVLEVPSVRAVILKLLLQDSYKVLLEQGADAPESFERVRRDAPSIVLGRMSQLAADAGVTDPTIHAGLFAENSEFFKRACSRKHPRTLVSSLRENNQDCPFPSLRQQVYVQLLRDRRKIEVGAEPGKGKTAVPILLMEQLRAEGENPRVLYVCPLTASKQLPNNIRPGSAPQPTRDCYYLNPEEDAPSVGVIASELKNATIDGLVQKGGVTFLPTSMLHSSRNLNAGDAEADPRHLIDAICAQDWDILVLDEAHELDGNGEWTRIIDRIIHGEDGRGTHLSRDGYIVALSGTPIMNTVADPVVIHDLFTSPRDRNRRYGGQDIRETQGRRTGTERSLHPLCVRQALNETLWTLDDPERWLENVDFIDYALSDREMEYVSAICTNPTLHVKQKIDATMQFILCPRMVSGDPTMPESLKEWLKMQLEHDLSQHDSILIVEQFRAQGVFRERDREEGEEEDEEELFATWLQNVCDEWGQEQDTEVRFHTIHGGPGNTALRPQAFADDREAATTGNFKNVTFAMSRCVDTGIRVFAQTIISLEWYFNSPAMYQQLKRALREGEENVRLTACYALNTVQQGTKDQAFDKHRDGLEVQYGRGLTDEFLRDHIRAREEGRDAATSEKDLLALFRRSSPAQRRYEVERWLHGRGMNDVTQFWDRNHELFRILHEEADELGTGDMHRFIGALVGRMIGQCTDVPSILDVGSNGMTLERELRRSGHDQRSTLTSTDTHSKMLERGRTTLYRDNSDSQIPTGIAARPSELHRHQREGALAGAPFDIAVFRNLDQCNHIQSDAVVHERARSLLSVISTTKLGGSIVIPLSRTACTQEEWQNFVTNTLPLFGCIAKEGWHGQMRSDDNMQDQPFRGFCVVADKFEDVDESTLRANLRSTDLCFTHHAGWANTAEGQRVTSAMRQTRLPYPPRHNVFKLGSRTFQGTNARPEVREAQEHHLEALAAAVQAIHAEAPTAKECIALKKQQRIKLVRQGILYTSDLSKTFKKPTFSLREFPKHLFFPYDSQWQKGGQE